MREAAANAREPAIPVATVRKMTGAITILTNETNVSPSHSHAAPQAGANAPSVTPAAIPNRTQK